MRLMLTAYSLEKTGPVPVAIGTETTLPDDAVWVDLLSPSREEDTRAEQALGVALPTFEEAKEIEFSSRFYEEGGAIIMTASLLSGVEEGNPALSPITFALRGNRIATIRYHDPRSFRQFIVRTMRSEGSCTDSAGVFLGLLEAIIDRLADTVEKTGSEIDRLNHTIFMHGRERDPNERRSERHLERIIEDIGIQGDFVAKTRESLASLQRLLQYADSVAKALEVGKQKGRIKLMARDARSLTDQLDFLSGKVIFLHKIVPGGTDKSYGIHVAKLAGIPRSITERSKEILDDLENTFQKEAGGEKLTKHRTKQTDIASLFDQKQKDALDRLKSLDVNNLTPIQAINLLTEIQDFLKNK
jgi:magnesium transporter